MQSMSASLDWLSFLIAAPFTLVMVPFRVHAFVAEVQHYASHALKRDLESAFHGFFHIRFRTWRRGGTADMAAMLGYGVLGYVIKKWLRSDAPETLQNSLLKGIDNVVSSIPSQRIWDLSQKIKADEKLLELFRSAEPLHIWSELNQQADYQEFLASFNQYVNDWGFRCSKELTLTEPSFSERPESLIAIIKGYCRSSQTAPELIIHEQNIKREELMREIHGELNKDNVRLVAWFKYRVLRILVKCAHKAIQYRELVRMNQAFLYSKLRILLLKIGDLFVTRGYLRRREDIFFLDYGEVGRLLYGSYMFPETVALMVEARMLEYQKFETANPADEIVIAHGEVYQPPKPDNAEADLPPQISFKGIGACGGKITGTIRVLASVLESNRLVHGDILVAKQTDPGWGPVFPLISGLIIERGGMLSHGAIISREFGIPAVVAVKDATKRLKDGQTVLLDGDLGTVEVLA